MNKSKQRLTFVYFLIILLLILSCLSIFAIIPLPEDSVKNKQIANDENFTIGNLIVKDILPVEGNLYNVGATDNVFNKIFTELIQLGGTNPGNSTTIRKAENVQEEVEYYLPEQDGTNGEVLTTDGSGHLSWGTNFGTNDLETIGSLELKNISNDNTSQSLEFKKSRGTGNQGADNGDELGSIDWYGLNDGLGNTNFFIKSSSIRAKVHATPGNTDMPGELIFGTNSASNTTITDRMTISDDGIIINNLGKLSLGSNSPTSLLTIDTTNTDYYNAITLKYNNNTGNSNIILIYATIDNKLWFYRNTGGGALGGYIDMTAGGSQISFTGQHRNILNANIDSNSVGLIVSSSGKYLNLDSSLSPKINESLPICYITNTDNDKKVFGVISDKEDINNDRTHASGKFVSVIQRDNNNEERMFINSLGEGSVWVCNKNGPLENGDYISSTDVIGYGGKQIEHEELLTRYTVAKITCDCDFSLVKIVKQKLKITQTTEDGVTTKNIDYDSNGDVQYEDDLDENGNQQMVNKYDTRFLQADGTFLTSEGDYNVRLANGENVYIACFVGCTYHCG